MPRRPTWPPPALADKNAGLIAQFARDYQRAVEDERDMPRDRRIISALGSTQAAVGWRLAYEAHQAKHRHSRWPGDPRPLPPETQDLHDANRALRNALELAHEELTFALACLTDEMEAGRSGPSGLRATAVAKVRQAILVLSRHKRKPAAPSDRGPL